MRPTVMIVKLPRMITTRSSIEEKAVEEVDHLRRFRLLALHRQQSDQDEERGQA